MFKKIWTWLLGLFGKKVHVLLPNTIDVKIKEQ